VVRFQAEMSDFSFLQNVHPCSDIHPADSSKFTGIKWPGLEPDHSPPYNAKIKNEWSRISSPHTLS
jgi:hypothetical protein